MDKTYDPNAIEEHWYQQWENAGHFAPSGSGDPYCIMIPPPNVTGHLHMGHAFQDTIMDILIRYHRMKGNNTLWQVGTDHAGIATQMVVERQLAAIDETRHSLGRDKFIEKIWDWKAESGGGITKQLRRMGASVDWQRERFTMDDGLSEAVTKVFVDLHKEDLIYRGKRLVNWDPVLHTAISDLEVESAEENGHMWHLRYPLANDPSRHLVVATTRPETMLGDSAVAVHPNDERYRDLVGQHIALPLTDRTIPIIADEYVDPEFGTGCVKITPAHDFNDYEVGKRHDLPLINIFTDNAQINHTAPEKYRDQDRFEARKNIVADLDALGLLHAIEDHKLMVPRGDRSGSVVEPYLTDQWYVKVAPLAEPAIDAVKNGDIKFIPENWDRTYYEWMDNIEDWCISRQIWWGHRVPAWYDDAGNCYVGISEEAVRQDNQLSADVSLRQDDDVLDTWFSSALWPFSTLGWPEKTEALDTFYPTAVLVTGFDIIFFWVARMIMMGLKFTGQVPFKEVYIHGLVRDSEGQKMSKSKGNVLDPLDVINGVDLESLVSKRTTNMMQPEKAKRIEKATRKEFTDGIPAYGMDALRFTFASQATLGRDIRFDLARVEGYRNFCTKLWNAARYVLMNTEDHDCGAHDEPYELSAADRWIIGRMQQTEGAVERAIDAYRFDYAANTLYDYVWNEYCDWYIELSKPVLTNPDTTVEQARGTRRTLVRVLGAILRLSHPFIPFITEEIWQRIAPLAARKETSIMLAPWPEEDLGKIDQPAIDEIEWLKAVISGIRNIRGEMNIPPRKSLDVLLQNGSAQDAALLANSEQLLKVVGVIDTVRWLTPAEEAPQSAVALVGDMKVLIPMAGLIDKNEELIRLDKEIGKLEKEIEKCTKKLENPSFVDRAPETVVTQEKDRLESFRSSLAQLNEQKLSIEQM